MDGNHDHGASPDSGGSAGDRQAPSKTLQGEAAKALGVLKDPKLAALTIPVQIAIAIGQIVGAAAQLEADIDVDELCVQIFPGTDHQKTAIARGVLEFIRAYQDSKRYAAGSASASTPARK